MKWFKFLLLGSLGLSIASPSYVFAEDQQVMIYEAYQQKIDEVYANELSTIKEYDSSTNFYYSLYDIDQNGIEELILSSDRTFRQVFTFNEASQEVVFLDDLTEYYDTRDYSVITTDGTIYYMSAGGAMVSSYRAYQIDDSGVNTEEIYSFIWDANNNSDSPYYSKHQPDVLYNEDEFLNLVGGRYYDTERPNHVSYNRTPLEQPLVVASSPNETSEVVSPTGINFNQDWFYVLQDIDVAFTQQDINGYTMNYASDEFDPIFDIWHRLTLTGTTQEALNVLDETFTYAIRKINHSESERKALNHIRVLAYYNLAAANDPLRAGRSLRTTKEAFIEQYNNKNLIRTDAVLNEIMNRVMISTGFSVQAHDIIELYQEGQIISIAFRYDELTASGFPIYHYDLTDDTIRTFDLGDLEGTELPLEPHFEEAYDLHMDYTYQHQLVIPSTYQLHPELATSLIGPLNY